ncbi:hypothetical protein ANANG_G00124150 [Anguilla anguilla]|uniref:RFX1 transcription activation region domain-containing protein n=1 Tax=Anguilla anguilla TaxID=7936 RepID=A0A9D3ME05_ANGAN|nr:hypothetical protein ANANG_G00124150 [Anguilla anguilla]
MQSSEGGSDSASTVVLHTSTSVQAPVVQPVPASQQVHHVVQHVYPVQTQYVDGGEAVYPNGTIRAAYSYNPQAQLYAQSGGGGYMDTQAGGGGQVTAVVSSASVPSHGMAGVSMEARGGQIISGGNAYIIHSGSAGGQPPPHLPLLLCDAAVAAGQLRDGGGGGTQVPLLRHPAEARIPAQPLAGGLSVHGHEAAVCAPEAQVQAAAEDGQHGRRPVRRPPSPEQPPRAVRVLPEPAPPAVHRCVPCPAPVPLPDPGSHPLPDGIAAGDLKKLQSLYRDHCEATLDVVMNLQFHYIEKLWQTFWCSAAPSSGRATPLPGSEGEADGALSQEKLVALCHYEPVTQWMRSCDHVLYQALVEILIPDVLRPVPSTLTQAIRNFAKSLEGWLTAAMSHFPQEIVRTKVAVVSAFAQTLRRYTSLNHLAQAARAVLQNTSQINQMLSDLNRVDFTNVQEQASWVCQCNEAMVQRLEQDFKVTLQQQSSLDQWALWLDSVVNQVLRPHEGSPSFPKAARQFLLKWSFYSSMVIRDLTLRSAASFGSFHLIRLLYDEYMFYLVEHRVAQATGETPIAVMGEFSDLSSMTLMDKDPSHFPGDIGDLSSNGDASRDPGELPVKRERIEISHSLQEI